MLASKSGLVVKQTLRGDAGACTILVKGYKPHDAILERLFESERECAGIPSDRSDGGCGSIGQSRQRTVVLFPAEAGPVIDCETLLAELESSSSPSSSSSSSAAASVDEKEGSPPKKCKCASTTVNVVALDGTWNQARKMATKIPGHVPRLSLRACSVRLSAETNESLLAPARRYRGQAAENGRVSTLEAVEAALRELGAGDRLSATLRANLKLKVEAVRLQNGRD